ncbi:MAG: 16S rRNA (cytosine(1402)-N(4))-methyltransferase RsmH [Gemmatimonadetes bacterium]|nr:16S rRNA (cytosine(1402)-N(4))-methyltransferase RsmH [Gemmatimonadota bacterium]MYH51757.1 16S rRNA (cytosine(1402)-N(4))-methyltransferase RsmH [Gemmatimonadota bacterium]MYK67135.1 16S rRNA (cytosine(1402)-N(4))-methyltransferase RsmH [Gemmatimonadota bacterium]
MHGPAYHRAVLVDQVMEHLLGEAGLYLDGTVGGGGHGAALLARCPECRLLAVDRDREALAAARARLAPFGDRVRFAHISFRDVGEDPELHTEGLAGALLDLGVSSHQLDTDERGFTMRRGAALDMRMDTGAEFTAAAFLSSATRAELLAAFRAGEAPRAAALATRIARRRAASPLRTSDDLVAVLEAVLGRRAGHAEKARLFQALRIRVNGEIEALEEGLPAIRDALRPGATFVIVAYHSVEDRVVKRAFRNWSDPSSGLPRRLPVRAEELQPLGSVVTRKPVTPGEDEIAANPRARPARLRAWRRAT